MCVCVCVCVCTEVLGDGPACSVAQRTAACRSSSQRRFTELTALPFPQWKVVNDVSDRELLVRCG